MTLRTLLLFALAASSLCQAQNLPLHGIYLHPETGFGVGGMMIFTHEPYVLLKDGTITDDLSFFPASTADVAQWRANKPRAWGRWTESSGKVSITWNDPKRKPEVWDKWFVAKPASKGMTLSGTYRSIGGGGNSAMGGNSTITAWKTMEFNADGTVTAGGGAGSYTAGTGGTSVATSSKRQPQRLPYELDGFSIRLNGEARWFYRYPDSDNAIGIGDSTFSRRR